VSPKVKFTEVPYKGNPWAVFPIGGMEHPEVLKNAEHFVELSVDERRQFGGKREVAATGLKRSRPAGGDEAPGRRARIDLTTPRTLEEIQAEMKILQELSAKLKAEADVKVEADGAQPSSSTGSKADGEANGKATADEEANTGPTRQKGAAAAAAEAAKAPPADEEEPKEAGPRFLFYNSVPVFIMKRTSFLT
jgi:hypothetical protein